MMKSEVKVTGKQLQITRIFDAPRRLVFSFWTQADKLQQWSGCKETTKCEIVMDFRVGGSFTQKMQITGAGEFTFTGKYDEIVGKGSTKQLSSNGRSKGFLDVPRTTAQLESLR
jgi:uncharacterized protein YndB with AHSA1/START domain